MTLKCAKECARWCQTECPCWILGISWATLYIRITIETIYSGLSRVTSTTMTMQQKKQCLSMISEIMSLKCLTKHCERCGGLDFIR